MNDPDQALFREKLLELKQQLESDIASSSSADESIVPDNAIGRLTRMEAIQAQSISSAGRQRSKKRLKRVELAIGRLEAGTYGECVGCGADIAAGRLEVMPESRLCTECASRA